MKRINYFILFVLILTLPVSSYALSLFQAGTNFSDIISYFLGVLSILIPILSGLAFIVFFWGVSKFILNSGKPEEIKNGKSYMIWGVLALFILLSFRAIIGFVSNEFELGGSTNVIPTLKTN